MSFTTDVEEGFAALLAADVDPAQNLGWQATGVYAVGVTGIYIDLVPAIPDRIVTLTSYGLGDDGTYADSTAGLQVRCRSAGQDPRDSKDLDDAIAAVLLGRYPLDLPTGVHVETLIRTSSTSLGQDDNQRWSLASNYTLGLHRPGLYRL